MSHATTLANFCTTLPHAAFEGVLLCAQAGRVVYAAGSEALQSCRHHPYAIASLSKQFCAVALLKLACSKALSLHAQLRHCPALDGVEFGEFAALGMHQLLSHSYLQARAEGASRYGFAYNNEAYNLLGRIIERLSGVPLGQCYRQLLFNPAGMHHSYFDEHSFAANYAAAGGIISCGTDLLRWHRALYHGRLLPRRLLKRMCFPHIAKSAHPTYDGFAAGHYGYGVEIYRHAARSCYQHCGGIPGYQAKLSYIPHNNVSVVLLLKSSGQPDLQAGENALQAFALSNVLVQRALQTPRS